jgi:transcriptional regulator with PAS, ATPase and Fis domain
MQCLWAAFVAPAQVGCCIVRVVSGQTTDDGPSELGEGAAVPTILMIATEMQPATLVIAPPAELGRRIVTGAQSFEVGDERMSRDHAAVAWDDGVWRVRDLESRNGTFIDGERISGEVRRRGDLLLRLGHTLFALLGNGRGHPAPEGEHVIGPELARAYEQIRRRASGNVLQLYGEPGTGKDLAARVFHGAGPRHAGPFVAVNCAAMPEGVAERLLFGARRGAFAGAIEAIGHFQMASGGTLFLDEFPDLDPSLQARILRVAETREVFPVGASAAMPIDLGIVIAGMRELRAPVSDRWISDELFQQIARATVHLPPLRERKVDLVRLVQREVAAAARAAGRALAPHPKLIEACCLRPWPGNIRELRGAVQRAAALARAAERDVVRAEELDAAAGKPVTQTGETAVDRPILPAELDKDTLIKALARANGVVTVAARALGVHRQQLYKLMAKHGIARDEG